MLATLVLAAAGAPVASAAGQVTLDGDTIVVTGTPAADSFRAWIGAGGELMLSGMPVGEPHPASCSWIEAASALSCQPRHASRYASARVTTT